MAYLITNANIVNEGRIFKGSVLVKDDMIEQILEHDEDLYQHQYHDYDFIDARNKYLIPGLIDDQVHFREPGLTHKADIHTESRAAIAGGITSFMEMPNTVPQTLTQELLEEKYKTASEKSMANYSFYMGASNDNLAEIVKTDPGKVCGIKVFMGASTGNMLVDDRKTLEAIFSEAPTLVAVHAEDEPTIRENSEMYRKKFGENVPIHLHPYVRSADACYKSSSLAVELAEKYGTRLHVLHLSTGRETELFRNDIPLKEKMITAEVCVHHLWFSERDYLSKGTFIKWNPAIKTESDRVQLMEALLDDKLDVVATDHAPHTVEEKKNSYFRAPSGGPLVQHALLAMMELYHRGRIKMEQIVNKMCHAPADCFGVKKRGYIRKGYFADLAVIDPKQPWRVDKSNILYKCGWSPFEGTTFRSKVLYTFVNGRLVYDHGSFNADVRGQRLEFDRN